MFTDSLEKETAFNIRKLLYEENNVENVTEQVLSILSKTKTNEEFVNIISKMDMNKNNR